MTYKVSIIVSIYNIEKEFLIPCIDSLLCQTYTNLEIILVDDGSTDGSGAVIDSYTDPRIIKIHTPNQGVTAARKTGWLKSSGDYCLFVDGDDRLAPDAVTFFMDKVKVKEYDVITGWYNKIHTDGRIQNIPFRFSTGEFTNSGYIENSISSIDGFMSHAICIYKNSVITEKVFDINSEFFRGEDIMTLLGILNNASTVLCTDHVFYHYVQRQTSVMHTTTKSLRYIRSSFKKRYFILNDNLKPLAYKYVMQKMIPFYLREKHWNDPQEKRGDYEFLLGLKAAYKGNLPLRLKLEFIIMKSRLLSSLYRTVGWPLMSYIKNKRLPHFK